MTEQKAFPLACLVEYCLCIGTAASLTYVVQGGFYVSDTLHANVALTIGACAIALAVLFTGVLRPSARRISWAAYLALALIACIVSVALSPESNPIDDVPQNLFVAVVIAVLVNLLVFVLSRSKTRCVVLFGLSAFVCALIQFLYVSNMLVATVFCLVLPLALIIFRCYLDSYRQVERRRAPLLGKTALVGLALPLCAVLLGFMLVAIVIMPLKPPHATIKLITIEMAYEEEYIKSAVEFSENADEVVTSDNVVEGLGVRTTTGAYLSEQEGEGNGAGTGETDETIASETDQENDTPPLDSPVRYLSERYSDVDLVSLLDGIQGIQLHAPIPWALIIALAMLAVFLLLTVPRYIIRQNRLRRISSLKPDDQVVAFYEFFLSRFSKLGLGKPDNLSPIEYANLFRERLYPFAGAQEAGSFDHLTALLVERQYGARKIDAEDVRAMRFLYNSFYQKSRKKLGLLEYYFRYISL